MRMIDDILEGGTVRRGVAAMEPRRMTDPAATAGAGETSPSPLGLERLAGYVVEVSCQGGGGTTVAAGMIWEAQMRREVCAWAMNPANGLYAPDLAALGIDLAALAVVRVAQPVEAAEWLVRSGAFGVVVVDCVTRNLPAARLQRLATPARQYGTAVLILTRKSLGEASLGVWIQVHLHVSREPVDGHFALRIQAIKDKRQGRTWHHLEVTDGPPGVC